LSQRCGFVIDVAEQVVERISSSFSASCSFVAKYENDLKKNGFVQDVFGKRRYNFEQGKEYLAKNFSIQSPAATICLEKLINLYFVLKDKAKIAYTVHDGYAVYVNKNNWKQIYKNCMEILTSESNLCAGLHLKVSCRGGRNLNDLKSISQGENND
jgi:DNA polymerase I-like protein with 3'-5' exonuclease and polymerase domains